MCRHLAWLGAPRTRRRRSCSSRRARAAAPVLRAAPAEARRWSTPTAGASASTPRPAPVPARWRSARPLWGDAVVRLGGPRAALRARCSPRCARRPSACRWTRPPPRRSPTGAGCSRTTAASTRAALPGAADGRVGRATPPCWPRTSSRRGPAARRRHACATVAARRPGRPAERCCSPTASGSSASPGATTLSYLVEPDGVVVASEPWDDDPRWVDVPDHHLSR